MTKKEIEAKPEASDVDKEKALPKKAFQTLKKQPKFQLLVRMLNSFYCLTNFSIIEKI